MKNKSNNNSNNQVFFYFWVMAERKSLPKINLDILVCSNVLYISMQLHVCVGMEVTMQNVSEKRRIFIAETEIPDFLLILNSVCLRNSKEKWIEMYSWFLYCKLR